MRERVTTRTTQSPALLDLLRWAAGADVALAHSALAPGDVAELLKNYRLSGRFLSRLSEQPLPWVTEELARLVAADQAAVEEDIARQFALLNELAKSRRRDDATMLIVKGLSRYAISGVTLPRRLSGDIDLMSSDLNEIAAALVEIGFRTTKVPSFHEYVIYARGDIWVDLHRYYPGWTWTRDLEPSDFRPRDHPGIWELEHQIERRQISYEQVAAQAVRGTATGAEGLMVPSPPMLFLLSCLHILDDYAQSALSGPLGTLRLVELAEVRDLLRSSRLDDAKVNRLAADAEANRARELVAWLIPLVFGSFSREADRPQESRPCFPQRLWYDFWVDLERPVADLFVRDWDMTAIVQRLGPNRVIADPGTSPIWYSALGPTDTPLERVLVRNSYGRNLPLRVAVTWTSEVLRFRLQVMSPLGIRIERVRIDFGDQYCELVYEVPEKRFRLKGSQPESKVVIDSDSYTVTMDFEWKRLTDLDASQRELPLWLGVVRQGSDPQNVLAGTIVPMILMRGPSPSHDHR